VWRALKNRPFVTDGRDQDDIAAWIDNLRERLRRGELARLAPIDLGHGALPTGTLTVSVMLADLGHLDTLLLDAPDDLGVTGRRRRLLADCRRLRTLIG
jgi:hypothetical protein